jgi:hypothetical protein
MDAHINEIYSVMIKETKNNMPLGDQTIINRLKHKINLIMILKNFI